MNKGIAKRFECLEHGCDAVFESRTDEDLVAAVQEHVATAHDSFELEDFILAGAIEVASTDP